MNFKGFFGKYGGQFVPETLIPALDELERCFFTAKEEKLFQDEFADYLRRYVGRPSPLYHAKNMSKELGLELYLKREDLNHTGSHKINNTIGQSLLAVRMGKKRIVAETGAGQHGVATATAAALLGLECTVYMGAVDAERQRPNVDRMKLLGAELSVVDEGTRTLKDATNAALRDWVRTVEDTHYIIGSVIGPYPFPEMVGYFQSVIGEEASEQCEELGFAPDCVVACVGGGSNALGIFKGFLDSGIPLIGVEAGGLSDETGENAMAIGAGRDGILHGCLTMLMQDDGNQVAPVHSIAAGLDYPGIGPEHAYLAEESRATYSFVRDDEAVAAYTMLARKEGIVPALESSHALAYVIKNRDELKGKKVLVNLSGRGDKDSEREI
ncbi:tryptophan synthase subunit beta [Limisalsivibrio acetivorans]|uniref:tryptophan synthase subunit beta n=1 Tax=Limisalsivibrio acetivorans TaxID=1304888 RepID=UPI0003B724F9